MSRGNPTHRKYFDELEPENEEQRFPEVEPILINAETHRPYPRRHRRPEEQLFTSPTEMAEALCAAVGTRLPAGRSESPIEEQLLSAFRGNQHCVVGAGDFDATTVLELPEDLGFPAQMLVWQQHKFLGRFRADFVVASWRMNRKAIQMALVECDGKAFHTGGSQQQRDLWRDRDAWDAGYGVFRFTGSEIYQDAASCVASVVSAFHFGSPKFPPLRPLPDESDPIVQEIMRNMDR